MSSPIWMPAVVLSESRFFQYEIWRVVEAQHVVSTMKIVDSLAEQELLEEIIEEWKPPVPEEVAGFNFLLTTPFRYQPLPGGSRFRSENDPGVFYGAERLKSAAAEIGYRRWLFLQDTNGIDRLPPTPYSAFSVSVAGKMVDLRNSPFERDAGFWTHPRDYGATQKFARTARQAPIEAILYLSVRDPEPHFCIAVLTAAAFQSKEPNTMQTWTLSVLPEQALWQTLGGPSFFLPTAFWR